MCAIRIRVYLFNRLNDLYLYLYSEGAWLALEDTHTKYINCTGYFFQPSTHSTLYIISSQLFKYIRLCHFFYSFSFIILLTRNRLRKKLLWSFWLIVVQVGESTPINIFFPHPYLITVFTKWECCKNRSLGLFYIPLTQHECTRVSLLFHCSLFTPFWFLISAFRPATIQQLNHLGGQKSMLAGKTLILTNRLRGPI